MVDVNESKLSYVTNEVLDSRLKQLHFSPIRIVEENGEVVARNTFSHENLVPNDIWRLQRLIFLDHQMPGINGEALYELWFQSGMDPNRVHVIGTSNIEQPYLDEQVYRWEILETIKEFVLSV